MSENAYVDFIRKYRSKPVEFVSDLLHVQPDPWQAELLNLVASGERRISVRSGHGVGKSSVAAWALLHFLTTRWPAKAVCTAPTSSQLYDALFAELKSWLRELPPYVEGLFEATSDRIVLKSSPESAFISARTSRAESPQSMAGIHSANVLLIFDEASNIPQGVYEAAGGSMSSHSACTLLLGNPVKTSGYFFDTHHRLKSEWKTLHVSCLDSKRVAPEYIREMALKYGDPSSVYSVRVIGDFPEVEEDVFISADLVESAMARDIVADEEIKPIWSVDVARFGPDSSVLMVRHGNVVSEILSWHGLATTELTGRIVSKYEALIPRNQPTEIIIDEIGIGAGIFDRCLELELPVRGINVGEAASMSGTFMNLRAELWSKVKDWLTEKNCKLPRNSRLFSDLTTPRYTFSSSGKLQIESKRDMTKRGVPSPDFADALCLSMTSSSVTTISGSRQSVSWKQPLKRNIKGIV